MNEGWVKLHRKVMKKALYKKSGYFHLFFHLVMNANHEDSEIIINNEPFLVKRGQILTGRNKLSNGTGISQTTVERILKFLENGHQIGQQKTNKFRLITINNYDEYQENGQQSGQQTDNRWTTDGQQTDTNKNDKNNKKDKNKKKFIEPKGSIVDGVDEKEKPQGEIKIPETYRKIVEAFEKEFSTKVLVWTEKRSQKTSLRIKRWGTEKLIKAIENLSKNPWNRGDNKSGWKANYDYIVRSDEIIETALSNEPVSQQPNYKSDEDIRKAMLSTNLSST